MVYFDAGFQPRSPSKRMRRRSPSNSRQESSGHPAADALRYRHETPDHPSSKAQGQSRNDSSICGTPWKTCSFRLRLSQSISRRPNQRWIGLSLYWSKRPTASVGSESDVCRFAGENIEQTSCPWLVSDSAGLLSIPHAKTQRCHDPSESCAEHLHSEESSRACIHLVFDVLRAS